MFSRISDIEKVLHDSGAHVDGPAPASSQETVSFSSGARRSKLMPRYDLLPSIGLRRLSARYAMGAALYGEYNWQKGLPMEDTINHVIHHLVTYRDALVRARHDLQMNWDNVPPEPCSPGQWIRDRVRQSLPDGDELAAAAWGCFTLMEFDEKGQFIWMSDVQSPSTTSPSTSASVQPQPKDTTS